MVCVHRADRACLRPCCCRSCRAIRRGRGCRPIALEAATLLKADRNAAIRRQAEVATLVDAASRAIRSGATAQMLRIPDDVHFDALLPQTCRQRAALSTISFFADGMSCGGTIALTRLDAAYEIRVNWLTGRIEIVPRATLAN